MARKKMVTRTITNIKVNVLCLDTETAEVSNELVLLPGKANTYRNNKAILAAAQEVVSARNPNNVAASIVDITESSELRGMTETDFLAHSKVLKPGNQETEN